MADQSDKLKIICANCGAQYLVTPERVGQKVQCLKCRSLFIINPLAPVNPAGARVSAWQAAINARSGEAAPSASSASPPGSPRPAVAVPPAVSAPVPGAAPASAVTAPIFPSPAAHELAAKVSIKSRCPHCDFSMTLPRTFIGGQLGCPQCKNRFTVAEEASDVWEEEEPLWRRLLEDRRALYAAAATVGILLAAILMTMLINHQARSRLMIKLTGIYHAPNYTLTRIKAPAEDSRIVHKNSAGSARCGEVAYIHVAHGPSGMEFDRVFCRFGSGWEPTYRQTLADGIALDQLKKMETNADLFDPGEIPWQVFSPEAANLGTLCNTALTEEQEVALISGSAYDQLTHGNDWNWYGSDEDDRYRSSDPLSRYYLAHAVMYPGQALALYESGKIAELP